MKMSRQDVYEAFESERYYQEKQIENDDRPDMIEDLHIGDTLTAIRYNLRIAEEAWYSGSTPHQETMEYLRKIGGLIVQAGEKYGIPERKEKSFECKINLGESICTCKDRCFLND